MSRNFGFCFWRAAKVAVRSQDFRFAACWNVVQALVDAGKVPHRVILSEAKNLSSV
jgi:hypothetical protein